MVEIFKSPMHDVFKRIVINAEDAIIAVNARQEIILFNRGAERIFGYTPDEVLGQTLGYLIPERFRAHHEILVKEFSDSDVQQKYMGERSKQIFGLRKDGTEFPASVAIMKVGTKKQPVFAAFLRDISEHKKTEDELLRLAATDPLTGAFNRREFLALTERESLRARRYNRPLSVLMLDLDHFKKLNDNYGHAAGDKTLQRFTAVCCNALRNVDIFGRWGGEEFVALLPETDAEGAGVIAERLRQLVEDIEIDSHGQKFKITTSIGVADYHDNETTIDGPLSRADAALYEAKKAGRNCVRIYDPVRTPIPDDSN